MTWLPVALTLVLLLVMAAVVSLCVIFVFDVHRGLKDQRNRARYLKSRKYAVWPHHVAARKRDAR